MLESTIYKLIFHFSIIKIKAKILLEIRHVSMWLKNTKNRGGNDFENCVKEFSLVKDYNFVLRCMLKFSPLLCIHLATRLSSYFSGSPYTTWNWPVLEMFPQKSKLKTESITSNCKQFFSFQVNQNDVYEVNDFSFDSIWKISPLPCQFRNPSALICSRTQTIHL